MTARWWELLIPGATALGGAALGSWLQGINGRRLFSEQAADAARAREHHAAQERLMRIYDHRRDAYAALLTSGQRYHSLLIDLHLHPKSAKSRIQELSSCRDEAEARRDVLLLLAPDNVIGAMADMLHGMWLEPDTVQPHEFGWKVNAFMRLARQDLGVEPGAESDAGGQAP